MATLKEIAKKTGVSIPTVSRVLNKDTTLGISASRKQEILDVARELNYESPRKKSFKVNNTSKKILIVTRYSNDLENADPYYLRIRLAIENYLRSKGFLFSLICVDSIDSNTLTNKADGYIFIGVIPVQIIQNFSVYSDKMVFVDSSPRSMIKDTILVDFRMGVDSALNYLTHDMGYQSIGFIGGITDINSVRFFGSHRQMAFQEFMMNIDKYKEEFVFIGDYSMESGYEMMKQAIATKHLPRAFFIATDSMAIGALKALNEAGISVPDQVSIIGFNDNTFSRFTFPPLTTVKVHIDFMAHNAVDLLIEQFEGRTLAKTLITPTELILRSSH